MPHSDSEVSPLSQVEIERAFTLVNEAPPVVEVFRETTSTNDRAREGALAGAADGTLYVADQQTAGRGRLGRSWESSPGQALLFSMLVDVSAHDTENLGWVPLIMGLAVCETARSNGLPASVKWPNDVVSDVGDGLRKLCGVLAELVDKCVIVGVGINIQPAAVTGVSTTSIVELGGATPRQELLALVVARWRTLWHVFVGSGADPERSGIKQRYLDVCTTIGRQVVVDGCGAETLVGRAVGIDRSGHLMVDIGGTCRIVTAGDVQYQH